MCWTSPKTSARSPCRPTTKSAPGSPSTATPAAGSTPRDRSFWAPWFDPVIWLRLARESITQDELKERVGDSLTESLRWKSEQGHTDGPLSLESRRRCWTRKYQGFHLDVLPAIPDDEYPPTGILLTDENPFRWQHSNPIGYADWFTARSETSRLLLAKRHASVADVPAWETRSPLQGVVQILKWHCMITFGADLDNRPPSILLTTLAGRAYDGEDDLFTAVRGVLDDMPQFVEKRAEKWWVPNPAHPEENFTDKWNDHPERRKAFYHWLDQIATTMKDLAGMEGKGLDAVYSRMIETFDRSGRRVPGYTFYGHGHLARG
jgi:hypothetical protein